MALDEVDVLVSTEWVDQHKYDNNIQLVEVDNETCAYSTGDIETAVYWNWSTELNDQIQRDILTPEQIAYLLGKLGITPESIIVLYGDNNNWFAAFAYWQLKMFGHRNVCIMD